VSSVINSIKSAIKDRPSWYDRANAVRRFVGFREGELYRILDTYDRSKKGGVVFAQIGANDGLRNDPVREFVVRGGWRGVLVEPLPGIFEMLKENYAYLRSSQLHFANCAVADTGGGSLELFTLTPEFLAGMSREKRLSMLRKASLTRSHVEKFVAPANRAHICSQSVRSVTFEQLLAEAAISAADLDVLVIDAEGHEQAILGSIDFDSIRPELVVFESHHLGETLQAVTDLFTRQGYTTVKVGPDSVAAHGAGLVAVKRALGQ
jgi:FkbM family methyltransferase